MIVSNAYNREKLLLFEDEKLVKNLYYKHYAKFGTHWLFEPGGDMYESTALPRSRIHSETETSFHF